MSTLAVIPARLGATRLPRKPMRLLGGIPLVVRVWERVTASGVADRVVVATDSPEIAAAATEAGAQAVLTDVSHPSGTDRVAEVARRAEFARYSVILNVQGDEPFVVASALAGATALVLNGDFPLATAAARASRENLPSPDVVKVVCDDTGRAMYFSRAPIPFLRDNDDSELLASSARRHLGVYAYTRDALEQWVSLPPHPLERLERLEQLRPLAAGLAMGVVTVPEVPLPGIDTEADLVAANARWTHFVAGQPHGG